MNNVVSHLNQLVQYKSSSDFPVDILVGTCCRRSIIPEIGLVSADNNRPLFAYRVKKLLPFKSGSWRRSITVKDTGTLVLWDGVGQRMRADRFSVSS